MIGALAVIDIVDPGSVVTDACIWFPEQVEDLCAVHASQTPALRISLVQKVPRHLAAKDLIPVLPRVGTELQVLRERNAQLGPILIDREVPPHASPDEQEDDYRYEDADAVGTGLHEVGPATVS